MFSKIYATIQAFDNVRNGFNHIARREEDERRAQFLRQHLLRRQQIHILHGSMEANKRERVRNRP